MGNPYRSPNIYVGLCEYLWIIILKNPIREHQLNTISLHVRIRGTPSCSFDGRFKCMGIPKKTPLRFIFIVNLKPGEQMKKESLAESKLAATFTCQSYVPKKKVVSKKKRRV